MHSPVNLFGNQWVNSQIVSRSSSCSISGTVTSPSLLDVCFVMLFLALNTGPTVMSTDFPLFPCDTTPLPLRLVVFSIIVVASVATVSDIPFPLFSVFTESPINPVLFHG